ncbi:MAG: hypothetical protein ONB13_12220 [candidate division KSB1 bacterium]|nr:hypothetical protein [candidate division KSB1 bacterium]MDZ7401835.1 hypothetical protein [candidate division KSB1 bacterium]
MEAINKQLSARAIVNVVSSARIQEIPEARAAIVYVRWKMLSKELDKR